MTQLIKYSLNFPSAATFRFSSMILYRQYPKAVALRNLSFLLLLLTSCVKGPQRTTEVYSNDFEQNDLTSISGGIVTSYGQNKTLGRYNGGSFTLNLKELPVHDMIEVSFDLYIHDSWDGNSQGADGPDLWEMSVDGETFIHTTFSNCRTGLCIPQSYPLNYLNNKHNPGSGAFRTDLPGICKNPGLAGGTSLYKIVKTIRHSDPMLNLQCKDMLRQTDSSDPVCEESWAVDNLVVKVIKFN